MKGTASQPNYKSRHRKRQAQRAGRGPTDGRRCQGSKPNGRDSKGRGAQPDGGTPRRTDCRLSECAFALPPSYWPIQLDPRPRWLFGKSFPALFTLSPYTLRSPRFSAFGPRDFLGSQPLFALAGHQLAGPEPMTGVLLLPMLLARQGWRYPDVQIRAGCRYGPPTHRSSGQHCCGCRHMSAAAVHHALGQGALPPFGRSGESDLSCFGAERCQSARRSSRNSWHGFC